MTGGTEEGPAVPAWAEQALDAILAALPAPEAAALRAERNAYLDCLAGLDGPADPLPGRQECHAALMRRLRARVPDPAALERLHLALEALEADLSART